ncbi:glycosyltransferase [Methylobacterium radiodurans]|uniref:Glycosyltransferase n=1 Tax=Methylobacterium radiodurans TaxID=2202828 RepID=A0A2U8VLI7_9HYPH|nr:glycosyltransferase [Methylobacterium radiodurans]AWN34515.1 glycosyltransferase [Methylobacterium radiodurans]
MTRPIGYYVHHQGAGHWHRACAVAGALDRPCAFLGTFAGLDTAGAPGTVIDLPDDRLADGFDGQDGEADRPLSFHYAPLGHSGLRARMARIAAWAAEADPALLVVDVSCEVALFARLLSLPTLVVRLAGTRTDPPHLEAFRSADRLIAPFPEILESETTSDWVRAKTHYAGFLGPGAPVRDGGDGSIAVVFGRGGAGGALADLAAAARAVPDRDWHVLGPVTGEAVTPPNLHLHGWVPDVEPWIARAALVVGGAGDGVVATVAARSKRFVCLPEERGYGEQIEKARGLARLGAAVMHEGWPDASRWRTLVMEGLALEPARIGSLAEPGALARTAAFIAERAAWWDRRGDAAQA